MFQRVYPRPSPTKVRVRSTPSRRGSMAGLRTSRRSGREPVSYRPSLPSRKASAYDGVRSSLPLRGSPGITPGSLFRRCTYTSEPSTPAV